MRQTEALNICAIRHYKKGADTDLVGSYEHTDRAAYIKNNRLS